MTWRRYGFNWQWHDVSGSTILYEFSFRQIVRNAFRAGSQIFLRDMCIKIDFTINKRFIKIKKKSIRKRRKILKLCDITIENRRWTVNTNQLGLVNLFDLFIFDLSILTHMWSIIWTTGNHRNLITDAFSKIFTCKSKNESSDYYLSELTKS